ncbi:MAG: hypothetical protein O3A37_00800 [Planctomycetota bacterium]|jgi:hypothetical protein|nr:hypothetical protein [Planctomycetota bacterium]
MSTQADVKSIDTLVFIKTALAAFAHESGQSLSEIEIQSQRAVDWITVDQAAYWKAEVRRAADQVNKAIKDLEHCRAFKKVGDNQPSCIEEKKALEKARRRQEYTERKAELVRRWTPTVQQQFRETCVRLVRFREVIDVDCPKAMARLDQMLRALDAYRSTAGPAAGTATGSTGGVSMTRPADESVPTASAAAEPAPPSPREGT